MSNLEIRPRFVRWSQAKPEEIVQTFETLLQDKNLDVKGFVLDDHIYLKIPARDQHYWSPQLHLEIQEDAKGSRIRGLFGPRPSVWLMFIFFYFVLGFGSIIVAIVGFSQMNLGISYRILWLMPILLGLIFMVYSSAKAGQRMGMSQMEHLYKFFDKNLPQAEDSMPDLSKNN